MARIVVTELASADEARILSDLVDTAGPLRAAKVRTYFKELYERLGAYPSSGAPRPALGTGIRIGVVWPFVVIYRYAPEDDIVTVLRLVHGRRDISGQLLNHSIS